MKKTIILLAYAFAAVTVQAGDLTLTYWGGNDGKDLFTVEQTWRYPEGADPYLEYNFPYLSDSSGARRLLTEELTTLTTKDDTTYNLQFNTNGDVNFKLNESIYFNEVDIASGTMPNSITIDFGETGAITTASHFNIGQKKDVGGVIQRPAMTLSADFSAEKLAELVAQMYAGSSVEVVVARDILVANGGGGFWNVSETVLTFNDSESLNNLGFVNVGVVKSAEMIQAGQYGLVYTDGSKDKLTLVARAPEPATATLGLLALTGLAARRRRH